MGTEKMSHDQSKTVCSIYIPGYVCQKWNYSLRDRKFKRDITRGGKQKEN